MPNDVVIARRCRSPTESPRRISRSRAGRWPSAGTGWAGHGRQARPGEIGPTVSNRFSAWLARPRDRPSYAAWAATKLAEQEKALAAIINIHPSSTTTRTNHHGLGQQGQPRRGKVACGPLLPPPRLGPRTSWELGSRVALRPRPRAMEMLTSRGKSARTRSSSPRSARVSRPSSRWPTSSR